jgi:hypothetical protein
MFFGDFSDYGVEVGRAVGLGVPKGVVEGLRSDDDKVAVGGDALPGAHDVGVIAALVVDEDDGGERLGGVGGNGDLVEVVALLAVEGEGVVHRLVFGGGGGEVGEEEQQGGK